MTWRRTIRFLAILISGWLVMASISSARGPAPTSEFLHPQPALAAPQGHSSKVRGGDLYSHGGTVLVNPGIYISWWGTEWINGFSTGGYTSAQAQTYISDFFGGIGGTSWNNLVTRYCENVPKGTTDCSTVVGAVPITNPSGQLKGEWNDPTPVPAAPSQADITKAAKRLAAHFGDAPEGIYMVFTPTGKSMPGFGTQYCGWHNDAQGLAYAYMPYMPDEADCWRNSVNFSNNSYGNGWFDGFSRVGGHEYSEAETDPIYSRGWLDAQGQENADKCEFDGTANLTIGNHIYAVQPTWSNESGGCTYA